MKTRRGLIKNGNAVYYTLLHIMFANFAIYGLFREIKLFGFLNLPKLVFFVVAFLQYVFKKKKTLQFVNKIYLIKRTCKY